MTSSRSPWRRALGITPTRAASSARSAHASFGRPVGWRCRTTSWWRRIRISAVFHASSRRDSRSHAAARVIRRKTNRRHMIGDHYGPTAGRQLCWSEPRIRFSARTGEHEPGLRGGESDLGDAGPVWLADAGDRWGDAAAPLPGLAAIGAADDVGADRAAARRMPQHPAAQRREPRDRVRREPSRNRRRRCAPRAAEVRLATVIAAVTATTPGRTTTRNLRLTGLPHSLVAAASGIEPRASAPPLTNACPLRHRNDRRGCGYAREFTIDPRQPLQLPPKSLASASLVACGVPELGQWC